MHSWFHFLLIRQSKCRFFSSDDPVTRENYINTPLVGRYVK